MVGLFAGALALVVILLSYLRSHRKELEHERRAAEHERSVSLRLREVDRLKDEFLANTSHELRTPLFGIIGLAEAMRHQSSLPESFRDQLATIVASGHRLQRLVGAVLDFSKLERDELELVRQPLDLGALVTVVLSLLRPLAADKNLSLIHAIPKDLAPVDADEHRLEQILLNLVGNAIKFTEVGEVEISARRKADRTLITVRDTGVGIAPEHLERIFQAFEQADGSTERPYGGTGLGLAVCRRLVELHGGEIAIDSTPGEGSNVSFSLPSARAETPPAVLAPSAPHAPSEDQGARPPGGDAQADADEPTDLPTARRGPPRPGRILVVDDEPVNRMVLLAQLRMAGYEVREAADGFEALQSLDSIDLILLDVMMPKISGFEVCRKLRKRFSPSELPIIFVTAKNRPEDLAMGFAAGGNDYLTKPVGMDELLARIGHHLELQANHRRMEGRVGELEASDTRRAGFEEDDHKMQ